MENPGSPATANHIPPHIISDGQAKHILGYILPEHMKNCKFVNDSITKYIKFNNQQKLPLKLSKFLDNVQDNFP